MLMLFCRYLSIGSTECSPASPHLQAAKCPPSHPPLQDEIVKAALQGPDRQIPRPPAPTTPCKPAAQVSFLNDPCSILLLVSPL